MQEMCYYTYAARSANQPTIYERDDDMRKTLTTSMRWALMILILAVATACANTITDTNVDADNSKADGGDASSPERNVSGSDELDDPDESDVLAEKLNEELNEEAADSKTEDAPSDQE